MPIVAMNSVSPSWLTSGPSTKRSMIHAVSAMIAAANSSPRITAAQNGKPFATRKSSERTSARPASSTIAPLREVEHAGRLEDQHEAQRDQRIEHAGEQAADQHLEDLSERDHADLSMH